MIAPKEYPVASLAGHAKQLQYHNLSLNHLNEVLRYQTRRKREYDALFFQADSKFFDALREQKQIKSINVSMYYVKL